MKKIVYYLMAALMLSACNKEEVAGPKDNSHITVINSDIVFDALGGTGTIKVTDLDGQVSAVSASDWCQVSVSGDVVTVTADENHGLVGRASRITLTSGKKSAYIIAQQTGMEYSFINASYLVDMDGGEFTVSGISTFPVTVDQKPDWAKITEVDGGFKVVVGVNDSGDSRVGELVLKCGDVKTVYTVRQKFDRVFSGNYTLNYYTNSAKTAAQSLNVTFERDASDPDLYYIDGISAEGYKIPVKYDPAQEKLIIDNVKYLGPYADGLWEYTIVNYATLDLKSNYVSYSTDKKYFIYLTYKFNEGKYTLSLYNSAPMFNKDRVSTGFSLYTFTVGEGNTLSSANRKNSILSVFYPEFSQK